MTFDDIAWTRPDGIAWIVNNKQYNRSGCGTWGLKIFVTLLIIVFIVLDTMDPLEVQYQGATYTFDNDKGKYSHPKFVGKGSYGCVM